MGDVSHIMPVIHPWVGCITGALHASDYALVNAEIAYTKTAQALAMTIIDLLFDKAEGARTVIENFQPALTKESYLRLLESINKEG